MKTLFIILLCFVATKVFSQSSEGMVEEKSSDWIRVTSTATVSKPKNVTTVKKKKISHKPVTPKQNTQQEFEKTNSQVNRFKKGKKD
jgi:hypothetical protein